jgi:hypothetical protein
MNVFGVQVIFERDETWRFRHYLFTTATCDDGMM